MNQFHPPDSAVVWLNQGIVDRELVGGKGASLSRLTDLGARVPPAFALTTHAYEAFAEALSLPHRASDVRDADLPDLRARIESAALPPALHELVADQFAVCQAKAGGSCAVAVRSSATAEDSPEFSFAGLHDTILDVRDLPGLERAITQCWASLWSDRAVSYRRAGGIEADAATIAVVVQQLIRSDVSFVVFTADPVNIHDQHLVIAATWGLGEAVVSGLVVPDHIVVGVNGEVLSHMVGDKHLMVIPGAEPGDGVRETPVPRALRTMPVMSVDQAVAIGAIARGLSTRLGFPADIEGAICNGEIFLLQARPITTLGSIKPKTPANSLFSRGTIDEEESMEATKTKQPTDFPEEWNAPVEHDATFMFDPMHFPFPMSPLSDTAMSGAFGVGFTTAAREFKAPIKQVHVKSRNMYHFERYEMFVPASEEEGRRMGEAAEATVKPEVGRLLERWNAEHLPAIKALLSRMRSMDVDASPAPRVAEMIDELGAILSEVWTIHFRIAIPMMVGMQLFDEFYADVFGGDEGAGHELLTGVSSESVNAGLGLSDLAAKAKELGLEPAFQNTPSHDLTTALGKSDSGKAFLKELRSYLDAYGYRSDMFDLNTPTWTEDPAFALASVRNYVQTGRDERSVYAAKRQSAETALANARKTLAAYPEAVRGQFEGLLKIGREASFLQEEHNFYIDQQALAYARLVFVRIGARLAREGVLAAANDIFMLNFDELRALFANHGAAQQVDHVRALVQTRKNQLHQAESMTPPPFIGPPPAGPPPSGNPLERGLLRFFGGPPQQAESSNQLKGNPGSRGVVSGIAHVARTLEEAGAVRPGEILVAVTTMPAWTPLFGVAAAVVTETGGPLSHCAIVAREYGIPAVVGAHGATRAIATGQRITVDGGRGTVTIDA